MIILALDLATNTGWCVDSPEHHPVCGSVRLKNPHQGRGDAGRTLWIWLRSIAQQYHPDFIAYETPIMSGARPGVIMNENTARLLIGLPMIVDAFASDAKIDCRDQPVQTIRKHFLGKGRPSNPKKAVLDRCKLLGWGPKDDNAADACAVWDYAKSLKDPDYRTEKSTPLFGRSGGEILDQTANPRRIGPAKKGP